MINPLFHAVPRGSHRGHRPPATVCFTSRRLRWRGVERCGCAAPGRSEAPRYAKKDGFQLVSMWKPMENGGLTWFNMVFYMVSRCDLPFRKWWFNTVSMHDGNSMNDSMAMLAQFLEKKSKSRKSRRDKSSSRSRSSSARDKRGKRRTRSASRELRELRRYREEAEASKKAAVEKEKQAEEKLLRERELQDLEARILKKVTYHQPAPKKPSGVSASGRGPENGERSVEYELQPLALKAIDWIMEKSIDVSEVKTWQGIEEQLSSLDNGTLKDFFAKHISESNIPRSKAQKVSQILEFLMAEVH